MAGAGFGGPLLICLLNLTLNEKSSAHSLQFVSKYHVSLDSLWLQIQEHTHHSSGPVKYHVSLDSLRPQIWEHTHCNLVKAAIYHARVELEKKCNKQTENRQRTENRETNYRAHSIAVTDGTPG